MTITWKGAAVGNWHVGRGGHRSVGVVIHLMDGSLVGTDTWFNTTPEKRGSGGTSAHYGIGKNGEIHQYVEEADTAYHAGEMHPNPPTLMLLKRFPNVNPNAILIGIEHEGRVDDEWTEAMIEASAGLIADICKRQGISIDRQWIVKHHEIKDTKACPGPKCPIDLIVARAAHIAVDVPLKTI